MTEQEFDWMLFDKAIAENMKSLSDEEIERVFGGCVQAKKCIARVKSWRIYTQ